MALLGVEALALGGSWLMGTKMVTGAGYEYGSKLAAEEASDPGCVDSWCKGLYKAYDAGYIKQYRVCGTFFFAPYGLPLPAVESKIQVVTPSPNYSEIDIMSTEESVALTLPKGPIYYNAKVCGGSVVIARDHIPAFLLDNGINIMDATELENCLKSQLSRTVPLLECRCIAKFSIRGKTEVASLDVDCMKRMKPGDVKLRMRIDENFDAYLQNPVAYEDKLKSDILDALGLDSKLLPNAKRHITIEKVEKGSIIVFLVIGGCLLAASAFASIFVGYWTQTQSAQARAQPVQPVQQPEPQASGRAPGPSAPMEFPNPKLLTVLVPRSDSTLSQSSPLVSISSSQSAAQPLGSFLRRPVSQARFINHTDDDGWEIVLQTSASLAPDCYTKDTLFQTSFDCYTKAAKLKEYDTVLGASGNWLTVVSKQVHERMKRKLVTLRTTQSELTVTADHRVVIRGADGVLAENVAGNLKKDDLVLCGAVEQKLTKVMSFVANVEVVELRFDPDDPVETFKAPRWGILTKGQRPGLRLSAFSPLGPFQIEEVGESSDRSTRPRCKSF